MAEKRQSIRATYDSRETGPKYHLTASVNDRTVTFMEPMADPFHHTRVVVGWRDLLRSLLRRHLEVVVSVGADPSVCEDVMELDDNYLGSNCTRRDAFNAHIQERLIDGFEGGVAQQRARGIAPGDAGLESRPHPEHFDGSPS